MGGKQTVRSFALSFFIPSGLVVHALNASGTQLELKAPTQCCHLAVKWPIQGSVLLKRSSAFFWPPVISQWPIAILLWETALFVAIHTIQAPLNELTRPPAVRLPRDTDLFNTRRWMILRRPIFSVLACRKSSSLFLSAGLQSCLAMAFRCSQEALHRRSSCRTLSASSSKST